MLPITDPSEDSPPIRTETFIAANSAEGELIAKQRASTQLPNGWRLAWHDTSAGYRVQLRSPIVTQVPPDAGPAAWPLKRYLQCDLEPCMEKWEVKFIRAVQGWP